jgi:DNA-binding Xre family transcriptional regulator
LMAQRGMTTAKALQAALLEHGLALSTSTVSRIVYKQPMQLDLSLLAVLCAVLQCTPNDLLLGSAA